VPLTASFHQITSNLHVECPWNQSLLALVLALRLLALVSKTSGLDLEDQWPWPRQYCPQTHPWFRVASLVSCSPHVRSSVTFQHSRPRSILQFSKGLKEYFFAVCLLTKPVEESGCCLVMQQTSVFLKRQLSVTRKKCSDSNFTA